MSSDSSFLRTSFDIRAINKMLPKTFNIQLQKTTLEEAKSRLVLDTVRILLDALVLDISKSDRYYIEHCYIQFSIYRELQREARMHSRQKATRTVPNLTTAAFHILLALADCDHHGYGIMRRVMLDSNNRIRLGPGTLYGTIKKLLENQLIVESDERPDPELDDQRRRYYRLTSAGRNAALREAQRLDSLVRQARAVQLLPKLEALP